MHYTALVVAAGLVGASVLPAAAQVELPSRKAGHWEIRMSSEGQTGMPAMVVQTCTDASTEQRMMRMGLNSMGQMCSRHDISRDGATYVVDAECQMSGMRMTSRSVFSGDFQSGYAVRIESRMTMPGQAQPQTMVMTQQARWVADSCQNGLTPGDVQLPTGQKVNIRDIPAGR